MRVERVVLEDHRDVAVLGGQVGDVAVADPDVAAVDLFEPGEHPQGGGLAAAGGADQHEELAVTDLDVELVDGRTLRAWKEPGRFVERDSCHDCSSLHRQVRAGRSEWRVVCGRLLPVHSRTVTRSTPIVHICLSGAETLVRPPAPGAAAGAARDRG